MLCEFVKARVRLVKYTCSLFIELTPGRQQNSQTRMAYNFKKTSWVYSKLSKVSELLRKYLKKRQHLVMSLKVHNYFILCSDKSKMLLHTAEKQSPLFLRQKPAVLNMATQMVIIGTVKKGLCIHRFQIGSSFKFN